MTRLADAAVWVLAATLGLTMLAWTNLTGFGLGAYALTYDDTALPRFVVALLGTLAVWLMLSALVGRGSALSFDVTLAVLGMLVLWASASATLAGTSLVWLGQSERLEGFVTIVLYALLYGAGLQVGRSKRFVGRLAAVFVASAVVLSLHGLLQVTKLDPSSYVVSGTALYVGSAFASLGNPNFLAGVLVIAVPIALELAKSAPHTAARWFWWAGAAAILAAVYATYSQGAWLALAIQAGVAVALWAGGKRRSARDDGDAVTDGKRFRSPVVLALLVVLAGVTVIVLATGIAAQQGQRLWGSGLSETGSARVLLVQTAASAIADRPVFGFGPDNYLQAFRLHRPDRYVEVFGVQSTNNNAHSWILQYAATTGIPGALLLVAALVLAIARSRPRFSTVDDTKTPLSVAVWIGLVGYVVQMMLNVAVLASTVPFWVLLGCVSAPYARRHTLGRRVGVVGTAVFSVLLVIAVVGSTSLVAADAVFMSSRQAFNGYAPGDPVALAEKAARLNPLSVKYARAVAQSRTDELSRAIGQGVAQSEVHRLYLLAQADFENTLRLSPRDYSSYSWMAGLQAMTGEHLGDASLIAQAQRSAEKAASLDRTHWSVMPLLEGDTSKGAIRLALSAPALP